MKSTIWISSLAVAAAGGWFAATMFAGPATGKEPRFPQLTMDQLSDAGDLHDLLAERLLLRRELLECELGETLFLHVGSRVGC